jgi:hypothetical protein
MWAAFAVAAVALAGTAFMLRFLIALLREGAPSVCYWVVPVRRRTLREDFEVLSGDDVEDESWARSRLAAAQGNYTARKPAGIAVSTTMEQLSHHKAFPGARIFVRLVRL